MKKHKRLMDSAKSVYKNADKIDSRKTLNAEIVGGDTTARTITVRTDDVQCVTIGAKCQLIL